MVTRAEHWVYKDSRGITLERGHRRGDLSWPGFERRTARSVIGALGELARELARPLDFGITRKVVEEVDGIPGLGGHVPDRWNWYLAARDAPAFVRSTYVDPVEAEAEVIDEESMFAMAVRALGDPCGLSAGQWVEWQEMYVHDTMARVPCPDGPADHLVVDDYDNRNADVPIPLVRADDGTMWAHRADMVTWPPLSMQVSNHTGTRRPDHEDFDTFTQLRIDVNWSLYWEEGAPGRVLLDRVLDRLREQGWTPAY